MSKTVSSGLLLIAAFAALVAVGLVVGWGLLQLFQLWASTMRSI